MTMPNNSRMNNYLGSRNLVFVIAGGVFLVPLLLATPAEARGYGDPGTGTFLYQTFYAAVVGGAYYLRKFVKRFWTRRNK